MRADTAPLAMQTVTAQERWAWQPDSLCEAVQPIRSADPPLNRSDLRMGGYRA